MSKKLAATQCQCSRRAIKDSSSEGLDQADEDGVVNVVARGFLSEYNLAKHQPQSPRAWASEPNVQYTVDYDDLCGPWPLPDHPALQRYDDVSLEPKLCTWKFITMQDLELMRQQMFDKNAVKLIIEQKLPDSVLFRGEGKDVFLSFAWEIFKYMRDNGFSGRGISSILGLFYLTHRFFLSTNWRSAHETYNFFRVGVGLHAFLKPPESDMIFNFSECDKLLDMFRSLYIRKLELVRSVCIPRYTLILKIKKCGMKPL